MRSLIDRICFSPSTHVISCNKDELIIAAPWGKIQVWRQRNIPGLVNKTKPADIYVLRFLGGRGRAELATLDPADRLPGMAAEVWTVNVPGFGGSSNEARISLYPQTVMSVVDALIEASEGRPIWVTGKSIGTAAALLAATRSEVTTVILRNVMPMKELIKRRHSWWNAGLFSAWLNRQIPVELDAITNAKRCKARALFLVSSRDSLVPPALQHLVIDNYLGPKNVIYVAGDHDERVLSHADEEKYRTALKGFFCNACQPASDN